VDASWLADRLSELGRYLSAGQQTTWVWPSSRVHWPAAAVVVLTRRRGGLLGATGARRKRKAASPTASHLP